MFENHEFRLACSIGIDPPGESRAVPRTMKTYGLRGTPSLVLIDKRGRVRFSHFGYIDDLRLGVLIGRVLQEDLAAT